MESNFNMQSGSFQSNKRPFHNNNNSYRSNQGRGGHSKNYQKRGQKQHYHKKVADNIHEMMKQTVPATIDLKNPELCAYVGEIYYKDSFLDDPWKKSYQRKDEEM